MVELVCNRKQKRRIINVLYLTWYHGSIMEFRYIFLQVLQVSELLQYNGACSDRSVVILLVFLANQLFVKKNLVNRINIMVTSCCCCTLAFVLICISLSFLPFQDHLNFHKLLGYDFQSPNHRHLRMLQCLSNSESIQKPDASDVHGNEGLLPLVMWTLIIYACHLFVLIVLLLCIY